MADEENTVLTITGTTAGDISYIVVYYDVVTGNLYNSNGVLYGNSTLTTFLDNSFVLEIHYVKDISTSSNPEEWTVWDGLEEKTVTSTLAFDNNYIHAAEGTVVSNDSSSVVSSDSTSISVVISDTSNIKKNTLDLAGTLIISPFGSSFEKKIVSYNSFEITGNTCTFSLDEGLPIDVAVGTPVRIEEPLYLFIDTDTIYEANIPSRHKEGVFKIPITVMSRKLLDALDYTGAQSVSGILEHNIYVKQNKVSGITLTGSSDVLTRDNSGDKLAIDSSDNNSYVFCKWKNGNTVYYTKGNDITSSGVSVYTINDGIASVQSAIANPVYSTESVLFRTFAFPFVVNNLISYGTEFHIPVSDTNWAKEYLISIIKDNISVGSGDSGYTFSNEFNVSSLSVSINSISIGKVTGLSAALNGKQDKLTSSNAGTGILISNAGVISLDPNSNAYGVTSEQVNNAITEALNAFAIQYGLSVSGGSVTIGTDVDEPPPT